jgi:hypothetical protein
MKTDTFVASGSSPQRSPRHGTILHDNSARSATATFKSFEQAKPVAGPNCETWSIALHEAGHAVVHIRYGGKLEYVRLGSESAREAGYALGAAESNIMPDDETATPTERKAWYTAKEARDNAFNVAGYFADRRWGHDDRKQQRLGARADFMNVAKECRWDRFAEESEAVRQSNPKLYDKMMNARTVPAKKDRLAALKIWARVMRELSRLARRDPSFEQQVKAVAAALCEKGRLTGDEVVVIMKGAVEAQAAGA